MNFLAHLYLSCDTDPLMVGNFLADFINNRQVSALPAEVQEGVVLHRQIDSYTDTHPVVLQGTRRLYDRHSKYAPVIIDVFYDYLLAKNWERFHPRPLGTFTQAAYRVLEAHHAIMPPVIQRRLSLMIADDWLLRYGTREGMEFTFERMKHRVSRPEWLERPFDSLLEQLDDFEEEFLRFFPEVIDFVQTHCRC